MRFRGVKNNPVSVSLKLESEHVVLLEKFDLITDIHSCADVSSFANSSGGFLVYEMDEDHRLPTLLSGIGVQLNISDADAGRQRARQVVYGGVSW